MATEIEASSRIPIVFLVADMKILVWKTPEPPRGARSAHLAHAEY